MFRLDYVIVYWNTVLLTCFSYESRINQNRDFFCLCIWRSSSLLRFFGFLFTSFSRLINVYDTGNTSCRNFAIVILYKICENCIQVSNCNDMFAYVEWFWSAAIAALKFQFYEVYFDNVRIFWFFFITYDEGITARGSWGYFFLSN